MCHWPLLFPAASLRQCSSDGFVVSRHWLYSIREIAEGRGFTGRKGRRERRPLDKPVATESRREHVVSDFLELIGRRLAGAAILGDFIAHLLTLAQVVQARALDRADVNKNVLAATSRLSL
jgi:hypothetical protein